MIFIILSPYSLFLDDDDDDDDDNFADDHDNGWRHSLIQLDVSSNCLLEKLQNHIGCICLTFLHCAFSMMMMMMMIMIVIMVEEGVSAFLNPVRVADNIRASPDPL